MDTCSRRLRLISPARPERAKTRSFPWSAAGAKLLRSKIAPHYTKVSLPCQNRDAHSQRQPCRPEYSRESLRRDIPPRPEKRLADVQVSRRLPPAGEGAPPDTGAWPAASGGPEPVAGSDQSREFRATPCGRGQ